MKNIEIYRYIIFLIIISFLDFTSIFAADGNYEIPYYYCNATMGLNYSDKNFNRLDTTKIKFGRKIYYIIENEDGSSNIKIVKAEDDEFYENNYRVFKFRGHWAGYELGINNYFNSNFKMSPPVGAEFMELKISRSLSESINFLEYNIPLIPNCAAIITGFGFEFSNFHFDNNNNITKNRLTHTIESKDYTDPLDKSKLSFSYLTLPVILEFQIPVGMSFNPLYIGGGFIGGLKMGSHSKVVYKHSGSKQKEKIENDFYLSPVRYGLTFRIGYRRIRIFANYYMTPLFEKNKGPELYPFSIGLVLLNF